MNQTWIPSVSMLNTLSRQNTNIIGLVRIFQTEISRKPKYIMKIFENVKRVYFFAAIYFSGVQKFHNMFKFFFIIQIAYWLHIFPELYFQKVKKEDMPAKIQYACLYLAFIVPAYMMRFTRVCLVLLFIHYAVEAVYHTCRILSYLEKSSLAQKIFKLGDMMFVLGRLGSVILAVLTFWYGLAKMPLEQQVLDLATGNFNTGLIRLNCLIAVCALQAFLMYKFIIFQVSWFSV